MIWMKPRHRRAKVTIAALTASAALVGGAQALAPAPAVAMVGNDGPCSTFGVFWIDCVVNEEGGGGSGESGGGSGSGGGGVKGNEVIAINGKAPTVIKVPVGARGDSGAGSGAERNQSGGPSRQGGGPGRLPRCTGGNTQNCRPAHIDCQASDGAHKRVWSSEECDDFLEKKRREAEREAMRKARQADNCALLRGILKLAQETDRRFTGKYPPHDPRRPLDRDIERVGGILLDFPRLLEEEGCTTRGGAVAGKR